MTKKKSVLLQVLFLLVVFTVVVGVLILTGCGDGRTGESTPLDAVTFNGDDYFATSTVGNITNQEAFDLMVEDPGAIFILLNLVDEVLLRGSVEIDYDEVVEMWEEIKEGIPELDNWMIQSGFTSEEEILRILELQELRQAAVYHLVDVTDEDVEEAFELWFGADGDTDFDEMRDAIYDELVAQALSQISGEEMARLRYDAGFEILNETLEAAYAEFLTMSWIDVDIHEASNQNSSDVIARINGVDITIGQVFAAFSAQYGLEVVFIQLDEMILSANFSVDAAEVYEIIDELRIDFGDEFDDIIASVGFESEAALFDYFERMLLEEAMLNEHLAPSEERLRELHAGMAETVSGSHILVDDYDVAADLIEQLQNADNFSEVFAELATEYSTCPSGASGGDLGSWEIGRMVAEFDAAILELEVGEFTDTPVETQFGYHIIYKTGAAAIPEFEDVRDELRAQEIARLQNSPSVVNELLMTFRQDAGLVFTNPALQARFEFAMDAEW